MRPFLAASAFVLFVSAPSFAQDSPAAPTLAQHTVVHVENGSGVAIEQQVGDWEWVVVCDGACDRALPTFATYRINGSDLRPSRPFQLEPSSGEPVSLHVSRASYSLSALGIVGVIIGGVGVIGGALALFVEAVKEECSNCLTGWANTTGLNTAWTVIGLSAATVIASIALIATNRHTTVVSKVGDAEIPLRGSLKRPEPDFARIEAPPMVGVPLLNGSF